jgi:hypothetical protein
MTWQRVFNNPMEFTLKAPFQPAGFRPGDKVYHDTFAGLVPAVVVEDLPAQRAVRLKYTAKRGAYKKGDIDTASHISVVYRDQVYKTRTGQYRIGPRRLR